MFTAIKFIFIILFTAATACAPLTPAQAAGPLKIYAFGDSITYGFAPTASQSLTNSDSFRFLLTQMLAGAGIDARIVNGGVPGETTQDAKVRFEKIFLEKPDVAIIMFGTNDCVATESGRSKVSKETYMQTLESFISRLKEKNIAVILMTPPPLPTNNIKILTNRHLMPYVFAAREAAIRNKVDLVDNYINFNDAARDKNLMRFFLPDAIHPNAEGHKLIAEGLFEVFDDSQSRYNRSADGEKTAAGGQSAKSGGGRISYINVAAGKNYIESAKNNNCRGGVLTDEIIKPSGFSETYFTSDNEEFPKWIIIDLGRIHSVKGVRVYNTSALDARSVSLYYSRELGDYNLAGEDLFIKPSTSLDFKFNKTAAARYIKIAIEDSYGNKNKVSLAEIEVYGTR
jgi:acyl-CoA thioesterase-1